ncbi:MAG: uroporphyrinogen-III synthase [Rhodospirillales bacterium]
MPRVLVTRPHEDAAPLVARLAEMGIDSVVAPMLQIMQIEGPMLDVDGVQGLLLTSANGVRALAARTERRDLPVYAVGDATALAAVVAGFANVISAAGDVDDLADLVVEHVDPGLGVLLHAAGTVRAGDLAGSLSGAGFTVRREMLYEAKPVPVLPPEAVLALENGGLDGVMIYSPRTARHFEKLVSMAGLEAALGRLTLFALSNNVDAAATLTWAGRKIAGQPEQEALLQAVRTCYY